MRVYKCKTNGLWKLNPSGLGEFETKEQAHRAGLNKLAETLSSVRKKIEQGILGYGR